LNDKITTDHWDIDSRESGSFLEVDVKTRQIIVFFILGLIVSALSGVSHVLGPMFPLARGILLFLLICSIMAPIRWGIPLFLILLLVQTDAAQSSSEKIIYGERYLASIWRLFVGPVRPSWIMTGCVLIQILKTRNPVFDRRVKRAIIWFATVPVLTGLAYGGFHTVVRYTEIITDLRFGMVLIASIVLFHGFLKKHPEMSGVMMAAFTGGVLGRHLCDLIYWLAGYGPLLGGTSRASVDTAKSTVVFALLFAIYLVMRKAKFLTGCIIGLISGLLIVVFGTRLIWLTSALCCMVLLYIFGAKRAVIAVPVVFLLVIGSLKVIQSLRGEALEVVAQRAESLAVVGEGNYLERLDALRYGEILNSLHTSIKRGALLWGNGYGSYYTDELYSFPLTLVDAHPEYAARMGKFFYCHSYLFQVLFKHGIIGLIIITALWLGPAWQAYKRVFDRASPTLLNGILGCLIAFIPNAVICLYWSGKTMLTSGFIIAVLISVVEHQQEVATEIPADAYLDSY
jgi:hypothetical protein